MTPTTKLSRALLACVASVLLTSVPHPASAQEYPAKTVTIIAPSTPGGGFDLIGRVMAEGLSKTLGKSFVVENRTGSGTVVGTQWVAKSVPDGHTLLVGGVSNLAFNAGFYKTLSYDPRTDFTPIGLVATYPYVLIVRADLPAQNYQELITAIKQKPESLTIATSGPGTGSYILAEAFMKATGGKVRIIPYRGAQPAYMDLLGGRVDMFIDVLPTVQPYVDTKRARALFITSAGRMPMLPDVPTVKEIGVPSLEVGSWFGLVAPSRTPQPVVDRLRVALKTTMKDGALRGQLESKGVELLDMSMPDTIAFIQAEYDKWTTFIQQAGIGVE